jgi:Uma2 family endonuclease
MALAPTRQPYRFTVEEYLAFERPADERHEYLDGLIYAMAGESPNHGRICTNLGGLLYVQLRGTPCEAFSQDTKVRCGPYRAHTRAGLSAYPDLVIVCGALQFHDQVPDVVLNPTVMMEVLSPSTAAFDRGEKFHLSRAWLPTRTDDVLVAQDRPEIEHYHRGDDALWTLRTLAGLEARRHLEQIGGTIPLADVYERLVFPAPEADAP